MAIRALIVDDSPFARKIIRHHLVKCGCEVVAEAENGVQAVALFKQKRPEIVTLDVMMPEVDGIDSLTAFRLMRKENPQVAIVVVSVLPFEKTRETFMREGAVAYVVKPFTQFSFEPVRQKLLRIFPEIGAP